MVEEPGDRIVRHDVRGIAEGDPFTDAQELADACRGLVLSPTCWPDRASAPRFYLSIPTASPMPVERHYRIVAEMPGGVPSPFVRGAGRGGTQEAGIEGWEEVPELVAWRGLGRSDGTTAQVVVQREGQHVHLVSFPSMEDAVRAALSLQGFEPRSA